MNTLFNFSISIFIVFISSMIIHNRNTHERQQQQQHQLYAFNGDDPSSLSPDIVYTELSDEDVGFKRCFLPDTFKTEIITKADDCTPSQEWCPERIDQIDFLIRIGNQMRRIAKSEGYSGLIAADIGVKVRLMYISDGDLLILNPSIRKLEDPKINTSEVHTVYIKGPTGEQVPVKDRFKTMGVDSFDMKTRMKTMVQHTLTGEQAYVFQILLDQMLCKV